MFYFACLDWTWSEYGLLVDLMSEVCVYGVYELITVIIYIIRTVPW